jgi:hypothetical protein
MNRTAFPPLRDVGIWCLRGWIVVGWLLFVPLSIYLGSSR